MRKLLKQFDQSDNKGGLPQHKRNNPFDHTHLKGRNIGFKGRNIVFCRDCIPQCVIKRIGVGHGLFFVNALTFKRLNIGQFVKGNCTHASYIAGKGLKFNDKRAFLNKPEQSEKESKP